MAMTDDLVVFVKNPTTGEVRKLLGQVKHSIDITASSKTFGEVIQAAWFDFNNERVFKRGRDIIALITGSLSATDNKGLGYLIEQAQHTKDSVEFHAHIEKARFSSNTARDKLNVLRLHLKAANDDEEVADELIFEFLKHFHLLGYDLDKKMGVVSSLMQSHIAQYNCETPSAIWALILKTVQDFNQQAGTITKENIPEEIAEYFQEPILTYMPKELASEEAKEVELVKETINWKEHEYAQKLAFINLIGSWNENFDTDKDIVSLIVNENYTDWISDIRELLQVDDCPLVFKDGIWSIKERKELWELLGSRVFDEHLDRFHDAAIAILKVKDPSFELVPEERYTAAIHGKVLPHSSALRKGIVNSLALIGSDPELLVNCAQGKTERISFLTVRKILDDADWILWGSLNNVLPLLAEASPNDFMDAVEKSVDANPSPFDELFEQEDTGVFGRNYLAGLLWALESIAWDEIYLTRVSVVLADLASHDPGGNWANRPINSLTDIFLPWLPHTTASVEKRQVALKTICEEQPDVGWKLLKSLLPNQHGTTSGTRKPDWRKSIPDDWDKGTTNIEFWEQSRFCAGLLVKLAGFDNDRLASLAPVFDKIPLPASKHLLDKLSSKECIELPEEERMPIWSALSNLVVRHKRFSKADWSLSESAIEPIEKVIKLLAPVSPILLHKRLFSERDAYFYEGEGV